MKLSEAEGRWNVIRETPAGGHYHPCTGEEYLDVLRRLPHELTADVKAIVLRRTPKRDIARGIEACKRHRCIVMHSFPTHRTTTWRAPLREVCVRHYAPWCRRWEPSADRQWFWLEWSEDEVRRYYLYHLFLHELGHVNEPPVHSRRRSEAFAEDFALTWARRLGELNETYDEAFGRMLEEMIREDQARVPELDPQA